MRLKDSQKPARVPEARSFERSENLRRVVTVVVHNCHALGLRFDLEAPVDPAEALQAKSHLLRAQIQLQTHGYGCERILYVMASRHASGVPPQPLASHCHFKSRSLGSKLDNICLYVSALFKPVGNHAAAELGQ